MSRLRRIFGVLAIGFALAKFTGCSAPQGPIGGMHINGCLAKCSHRCESICDENDPQIVPPHSSFHPLPTRAVFSRPEGFENTYSPLPTNNALPNGSAPATPLEVRNSELNFESRESRVVDGDSMYREAGRVGSAANRSSLRR
jgi:hypothetical protein